MLGWYKERMSLAETIFWKGWHVDGTWWKSLSETEVRECHPKKGTEGVQNFVLEMTSGPVPLEHQGKLGR